jgi:hypothetical protein
VPFSEDVINIKLHRIGLMALVNNLTPQFKIGETLPH